MNSNLTRSWCGGWGEDDANAREYGVSVAGEEEVEGQNDFIRQGITPIGDPLPGVSDCRLYSGCASQ